MRQFHCDRPMEQVRIELAKGGHQTDYRCTYCGQQEREIHNSLGHLVRWINLTVKRRLAEGESAGV
jgi:hypothetical protein